MIICIMQARTGSSRLPGKVLKEVLGKSMLELEIERIRRSRFIDKIVVATTSNQADDTIAEMCKTHDINCYRGSEEDVLDRFYKAAVNFGTAYGDGVIRVTGDCPLIDPEIADLVIKKFIESKVDYLSNTNPPTYPDGMDVEIIRFEALERAWEKAEKISEREHVTPYIKNHKEYFTQENLNNDIDLSHIRLTLDEAEDFELIKFIYERLYNTSEFFTLKDILGLMEANSEKFQINKLFKRNEGYYKSILNDKKVKA